MQKLKCKLSNIPCVASEVSRSKIQKRKAAIRSLQNWTPESLWDVESDIEERKNAEGLLYLRFCSSYGSGPVMNIWARALNKTVFKALSFSSIKYKRCSYEVWRILSTWCLRTKCSLNHPYRGSNSKILHQANFSKKFGNSCCLFHYSKPIFEIMLFNWIAQGIFRDWDIRWWRRLP